MARRCCAPSAALATLRKVSLSPAWNDSVIQDNFSGIPCFTHAWHFLWFLLKHRRSLSWKKPGLYQLLKAEMVRKRGQVETWSWTAWGWLRRPWVQAPVLCRFPEPDLFLTSVTLGSRGFRFLNQSFGTAPVMVPESNKQSLPTDTTAAWGHSNPACVNHYIHFWGEKKKKELGVAYQ